MKTEWQKFVVLFFLYIAQSVPMSFFSTVVPVIMRQENYSLELIGLLQLIKLPWIFKFLWAPFIDKKTTNLKQLKHWIIYSELFYACVIFVVGFFNLKSDFTLIIILMVIAFIASATQDIATDTFAILVLKVKERSVGNSMQSGGSFMGTLIGSGVLLIIYHYWGWKILLFCLAIFVLIALIPLLFYQKKKDKHVDNSTSISIKDIAHFFRIPKIYKHLIILIFYYSGIIGILAMLKPFLVDLNYSVKQIGFMSGIVGTFAALIASLIAGKIIKKIGRRLSLLSFLPVSFFAGLFFYFLTQTTPGNLLIYIGIILVWVSYGLASVTIYTISMDKVRNGREGTDFTIQIVLTHLSSLFIAVFSGKIADTFSYSFLYLAEIILCIFTFVFVYYLYPKSKKSG